MDHLQWITLLQFLFENKEVVFLIRLIIIAVVFCTVFRQIIQVEIGGNSKELLIVLAMGIFCITLLSEAIYFRKDSQNTEHGATMEGSTKNDIPVSSLETDI